MPSDNSLKILNLRNCEISTIPNGSFTGLDQLETLYLNNNPIARLESNTFIGLKSSKELGLQNCKIRIKNYKYND